MDLVKITNITKATSCDYNAKRYIHIKNRGAITRTLNRYSRRKLKQKLHVEVTYNNVEGNHGNNI